MREINFRGKRLDNGEWAYGDLFHKYSNCVQIRDDSGGFNITNDVIPETVGQSSALPDKNGNDIYEGDIVVATRDIGNRISKGTKFEVYYNEFLCHFALINAEHNDHKHGAYDVATLTGAKAKYLQVVGTIHDDKK